MKTLYTLRDQLKNKKKNQINKKKNHIDKLKKTH